MTEPHVPPTPAQKQHVSEAVRNPQLAAKANGGHPAIAATARPASFNGPGVVGAKGAPPRAAAPAAPAAHPAPAPAAHPAPAPAAHAAPVNSGNPAAHAPVNGGAHPRPRLRSLSKRRSPSRPRSPKLRRNAGRARNRKSRNSSIVRIERPCRLPSRHGRRRFYDRMIEHDFHRTGSGNSHGHPRRSPVAPPLSRPHDCNKGAPGGVGKIKRSRP